MSQRRTYQVKEVAALSGLTVRTLHHYDALGLLEPSGRTQAGYRLYTDEDLLRLQQILIGRELGLSLETIRRSLDDPSFDRREALRAQREALAARATRATEMIRAIDAALLVIQEAQVTSGRKVDIATIFDGFDAEAYAEEAEQRWGHSEAFKASAERTQRYTAADWSQLKDEQAAIYADAAALLETGVAPDDERAMAAAERHRLSIERWFYPCNPKMHVGLADLWEADRRFADHIDRHGPGLTQYLAAAVRANAKRPRYA